MASFLVITSLLFGPIRANAAPEEGGYGTLPPASVQERVEFEDYNIQEAVNSGQWIYDSSAGKWWYQHTDGSYTTNDWELIGDKWYHFDSDGWMQTGWFEETNNDQNYVRTYYLDEEAGFMRIQWIQVGTKWYYLNDHGVLQYGWYVDEDDKVYYLDEDTGEMYIGSYDINGTDYTFNSDGELISGDIDPLEIRLLVDYTYRAAYGTDYLNTIDNTMDSAEYAFNVTWDKPFVINMMFTSELPLDDCTAEYTEVCEDGAPCEGTLATPYHHKNCDKNLLYIKENFSLGGNDVVVCVDGVQHCRMRESGHGNNNLGLTYTSGEYSLCTQMVHKGYNVNVRILQHEMSHLFGCHDGECASQTPCIMNGGYDGESLHLKNIWCSECVKDFDPEIH